MRSLIVVPILLSTGCMLGVEGGAQTAVQTAAGNARAEGTLGASIGLGDMTGTESIRERASLGTDLATGRTVGEFTIGAETLWFSSTDGSASNHFEIGSGGKFGGAAEHSDAVLLYVRAGHGFGLGELEGPDAARNGYLSLSIDPIVGLAIPAGDHGQPHTAATFGLALSLRWDMFAEREMRFDF